MILTTTETIPGKTVTQTLGLVQGNTIRARHMGRDMLAGLKSMVGGEIATYTAMMRDAREQAISRMIDQAHELGANAVVEIRFTTSMVMPQASEILAYGTAVIAE